MLTALSLRDFRCFERLSLACSSGTTLFVGDNAQGKTSILEAACVLLRLQSPRAQQRGELVRHGQPHLVAEGVYDGHQLRVAQDEAKRRLAVDGDVTGRAGEYLQRSGGLVVWLGNADSDLVRGAAVERRRFLDFVGGQLFVDYLPALQAYERALRSRNFLLKRDASPHWRQIEAYQPVLEQHGAVLLQRRTEMIEALLPWVAEAQAVLSEDRETIDLSHQSGLPALAEEAWDATWALTRAEEAQKRQTVAGPHRGDLLLSLNGLPATAFASEGQRRTLVLALKLGQARLLEAQMGRSPLLLIDDIFGELDAGRRRLLLEYLPKTAQKWITTTQLQWVMELPQGAEVFRVFGGKVELAAG